jgi:Na+-transporting NADH:ubiquinone oxidoreductase subunit C
LADAAPGKTRNRDSVANVLKVAVTLSLVASVLVSATAVVLKPVQERNEARYRQQIILDVAGLWEPGGDVDALFDNIDARMVNLDTGDFDDSVDTNDFDAEAVARDPVLGVPIDVDEDTAGIRRRAKYAPVYLVRDDGRLSQVILPVYGKGLWSTMYGFLALAPDGTTVRGLRFYEHAETPGLGDQIDRPEWRAQWRGKQLFDDDGQLRIEVVRGQVDTNAPGAQHRIDGLSGATLTLSRQTQGRGLR